MVIDALRLEDMTAEEQALFEAENPIEHESYRSNHPALSSVRRVTNSNARDLVPTITTAHVDAKAARERAAIAAENPIEHDGTWCYHPIMRVDRKSTGTDEHASRIYEALLTTKNANATHLSPDHATRCRVNNVNVEDVICERVCSG